MKFFINTTFNDQNSGIEHAELKRAALFRGHQMPFKLTTIEWNPRLHLFLRQLGVADDECLNMFDYFQQAESVPEKRLRPQDIDLNIPNLTYQEEKETKSLLIGSGKKMVAKIRFFRGEEKEQHVSTVEHYDKNIHIYRIDHYDYRGFLSLSQYTATDNFVDVEIWYDVDGRPVLETYNRRNSEGKAEKAGWRLKFQTAIYCFDTIDQLAHHFLNLMNEKYWSADEPNLFILDRTKNYDWAVANLDRPAYTAVHLHNSHTTDAQDPDSVMNNFYEYALTNANRYDAIITATEKQAEAIRKRFTPHAEVFTIPVGIVPDEVLAEPRIPMKDRTFGKVLVTARVAPEKRIHQIIEAIGLARKEVPEISLDIYGYVDTTDNNSAIKEINKSIEKYALQEAVHLHDYAQDVPSLQRDAQVYALSSLMEGFNIALMEASSHGMVGVVYDVNYGPAEIIKNGENGFVIDFGSVEQLAEKLVFLFSKPDELQKMSDRAYELADRYAEENVWKNWLYFIEYINKKHLKFIHYISS